MVEAKSVVGFNQIALSDFIDVNANSQDIREQLLLQFDRVLITNCLTRYYGNQTKVAQVLGINRGTLRTRMKELGMLKKEAA